MYVRVEVVPGARREEMREGKNDSFILRVKEKAEGNQANIRVRELMALHFQVPLTAVRILTGHHSRSKLLTIDN